MQDPQILGRASGGRRLIFADPYLANERGHYLAYAAAVSACAKESGWQCAVVGNIAATEAVRRAGVTPLFTLPRNLHYSHDRRLDLKRHGQATERNLDHLTAHLGVDEDDVVVLNSISHLHLAGVAQWLHHLPIERRPAVAMILHFTPYLGKPSSDHAKALAYRDAFRAIQNMDLVEWLRILTDSDDLAREYRALGSPEVTTIPIPQVTSLNSGSGVQDPQIPHLVYLGQAESSKGFELLVPLALHLSDHLASGAVRMSVMTGGQDRQFDRQIRLLSQSGVRIRSENLDTQSYVDFVGGATVALLPYIGPSYVSQTSGVWVDVTTAGAIPIVSTNTWMSRQNRTWGVGASFLKGDDLALVRATDSVLANHRSLRHAALNSSRAISDHHSARRTADAILGAVT